MTTLAHCMELSKRQDLQYWSDILPKNDVVISSDDTQKDYSSITIQEEPSRCISESDDDDNDNDRPLLKLFCKVVCPFVIISTLIIIYSYLPSHE